MPRYAIWVVVSAIAVAGPPLAPACAGEPEVVQTYGMNITPLSIAVSPSGNKIMWCGGDRLAEHALNPRGHIRARTNLLQEEGTWRCAYTPGGRRAIAACQSQVIVIDRSDWSSPTILETPYGIPEAICTMETPPLAFVQWEEWARISVIGYRDARLRDEIQYGGPDRWDGRGVMVHPDDTHLYRILGKRNSADEPSKLECLADPLGTPRSVWLGAVTDPYGIGVGPDPQHLMVAAKGGQEIAIFDLNTGARTSWPFPRDISPSAIATSSDGYYVAMTSYVGGSLYVISGHDLRGLLDPASGTQADDVRYAVKGVSGYAVSLALHPTLPLAYVACQPRERDGQGAVDVVQLGIPGIDHPGG